MERGEERTRFHIEGPVGDLLNPVGNPQPMQGLRGERLQHQEMERALQQVGLLFHLLILNVYTSKARARIERQQEKQANL